jgi:hypothetical protein
MAGDYLRVYEQLLAGTRAALPASDTGAGAQLFG